jgi:hypothetical protein
MNMKKTLSTLLLTGLLASSALASSMKGTWTGKISDEKCGAKVDAACAKKCIEGGQKVVFVTDDGGKVIPIANPKAIAGHEGHHVKVTGTIKNDMLTVKKLEMAKDMDAGGMKN